MITFFFHILFLEEFYIHSKIKRKVERFPVGTLTWYMHRFLDQQPPTERWIFYHQQTYTDIPQAFKLYDYM